MQQIKNKFIIYRIQITENYVKYIINFKNELPDQLVNKFRETCLCDLYDT